jgi:hypothetical protein
MSELFSFINVLFSFTILNIDFIIKEINTNWYLSAVNSPNKGDTQTITGIKKKILELFLNAKNSNPNDSFYSVYSAEAIHDYVYKEPTTSEHYETHHNTIYTCILRLRYC